MKKILIGVTFIFCFLAAFPFFLHAEEITLLAPDEAEIMPGRDFYVVGKIGRDASVARSNPLNIKIELISSEGDIVRELSSNVTPNGCTDAATFLTDYEYGYALNDNKDFYITSFTPPEIVYDGFNRDSIRNTYNKIVVKDGYFSAIIFGGATKDIHLKYEDKNGVALKDIDKGVYTLKISAVNFDGETVGLAEKKLVFSDTKERLIANDSAKEFANENDLVLPLSIPGYWVPARYLTEKTNDFKYFDSQRFTHNSACEFKNVGKVGVLLTNLSLRDNCLATEFSSAFADSSENVINYYYYDIGEKSVSFNIGGKRYEKEGSVKKANSTSFITLLRAEHINPETKEVYPDFDLSDGVILSENTSPVFYGVFAPDNVKISANKSSFSVKHSVAEIKAVLFDEDGNAVHEKKFLPSLERGDGTVSDFEFSFTLSPNWKNLESKSLSLKVFSLNSEGETVGESEAVSVKASPKGRFISDVDESYWGLEYCNAVNMLGTSPSTTALNADEYISRGDFVAMVNNLLGFSQEGECDFADLDKTSDFYSDCVTASLIGYLTGDENGRIHADNLISREEAIIILSRISDAAHGEKSYTFFDENEISFWAKEYVDKLASNGIVTGFEGYLHPKENITVSEAAALIIKTVKWMYNTNEYTEEKTENVYVSDSHFSDQSVINDFSFETIKGFFEENAASFDSIASYITVHFKSGLHVGKVGNGLEMRDYAMGNYVSFSDNALKLMINLSSKFTEFSVKYNPQKDSALYFNFACDENGNHTGILYGASVNENAENLIPIKSNWYYFSEK